MKKLERTGALPFGIVNNNTHISRAHLACISAREVSQGVVRVTPDSYVLNDIAGVGLLH